MIAPGTKLSHLTVLAATERRIGDGIVVYRVRCDCGHVTERALDSLRWRLARNPQANAYCSNGCPLRHYPGRVPTDLRGRKIGKLTAIAPLGIDRDLGGSQNGYRWLFRCDCGADVTGITSVMLRRKPACRRCANIAKGLKQRLPHPHERQTYGRFRRRGLIPKSMSFGAFFARYGAAPDGRRYLDPATGWQAAPLRVRLLRWRGREWSMSALAREHGISSALLWNRLDRGEKIPYALRPAGADKEGRQGGPMSQKKHTDDDCFPCESCLDAKLVATNKAGRQAGLKQAELYIRRKAGEAFADDSTDDATAKLLRSLANEIARLTP